jgi:hypothetical protein
MTGALAENGRQVQKLLCTRRQCLAAQWASYTDANRLHCTDALFVEGVAAWQHERIIRPNCVKADAAIFVGRWQFCGLLFCEGNLKQLML